MKLILRSLPLFLALATSLAAQTILFDFGIDTDLTSPGFNNVVGDTTAIADLVDSTDASTGISFTVSGFNTAENTSGVGTAVGAYPGSATGDNLYGNTGVWSGTTNPEITMVFSNLDTAKSYDFEMFASRMGVTDVRTALYSIEGLTSGSAVLDAANNESNTALVSSIIPTAGGAITITMTPDVTNTNGTGFFYLGAMTVTVVPEPATITLALGALAIGFVLLRRRRA